MFFFKLKSYIFTQLFLMLISGVWHCTANLGSEVVKWQVYLWIFTGFKTQEEQWRLEEKKQTAETKDANKKQKNATKKKDILCIVCLFL